MAGTEKPQGNVWKFSERNAHPSLKPSSGSIETDQPTSKMMLLVETVSTQYIEAGWEFVSVVEDGLSTEEGVTELFIIYTHPNRISLSKYHNNDIYEFIRPGVNNPTISTDKNFFYGDTYLPPAEHPLNQALVGVNWTVQSMLGQYNFISGKKDQEIIQTGVGYFNLRLCTTDQRVANFDQKIGKLMDQIRPLEAAKNAFLGLRTSEPESFLTLHSTTPTP